MLSRVCTSDDWRSVFDSEPRQASHDIVDRALQQRVADETLEKPDHPMLGLIRKARLDLDSLLTPGRTRDLKNKLEGAGNHLTKSIVKYWSQNINLQMRFATVRLATWRRRLAT